MDSHEIKEDYRCSDKGTPDGTEYGKDQRINNIHHDKIKNDSGKTALHDYLRTQMIRGKTDGLPFKVPAEQRSEIAAAAGEGVRHHCLRIHDQFSVRAVIKRIALVQEIEKFRCHKKNRDDQQNKIRISASGRIDLL